MLGWKPVDYVWAGNPDLVPLRRSEHRCEQATGGG